MDSTIPYIWMCLNCKAIFLFLIRNARHVLFIERALQAALKVDYREQ